MAWVNARGRAKNGREVKAAFSVRNDLIEDVDAIEQAARRECEDSGIAYIGWDYDDHPRTVALDLSARAAIDERGLDHDDALLSEVVGVVRGHWKEAIKWGRDPGELAAELRDVASWLVEEADRHMEITCGQAVSARPPGQ